MAERKRSNDMSRDSDKMLGAEGEVSHGGRKGGQPARRVAAKDEEKRAYERPAGATRVTKSMEKEKGE